MSNKRNPGKNGSLQRNMERIERRGWRAYHRAHYAKKHRIRDKAWRVFVEMNHVRLAYIHHCYFGDTK